ncbi:hypothetical protein D3C76_1227830 [compost metagenome]
MLSAAQRCRLQRHILGSETHSGEQCFGPPAQAVAFSGGELCQHGVEHRQGIEGVWQVLFHTRHQAVSGKCNRADGRGFGTVEDLQEGTFAAAVIAQQTNAVAFFQGKGEVVEQRVKGSINTERKCSQ